ncbi:hypothetical protein GJ496_002590 [Pomphorhynchus laevis]|nr:hypothetical protein GJ496_002590 [Pomphorhynchus laevis]
MTLLLRMKNDLFVWFYNSPLSELVHKKVLKNDLFARFYNSPISELVHKKVLISCYARERSGIMQTLPYKAVCRNFGAIERMYLLNDGLEVSNSQGGISERLAGNRRI